MAVSSASKVDSSGVILLLLLGSLLLCFPSAAVGAGHTALRSQGFVSSRTIAHTIWTSGSTFLRGNINGGKRSNTGSTAVAATTTTGATTAAAGSAAATTAAAGAGCAASALEGFAWSAPLGSSLMLHWRAVDSSRLALALEAAGGSAAAAGWFSVGWSATGRMAASDAVVGNLAGGAVQAVYMSGTAQSDVQPTSSFDIGNAQLATSPSGSTVLKFNRSVGDGSVPVSVQGSNTLVWAHSSDGSQTLGFHGDYDGALQVDFACSSASSGGGGGGGTGS
ncbi:unnamed protein product [Closterium sp. Naga37s-1]|nr:unnamed protein product [Closterium sp. Naga37s-1]